MKEEKSKSNVDKTSATSPAIITLLSLYHNLSHYDLASSTPLWAINASTFFMQDLSPMTGRKEALMDEPSLAQKKKKRRDWTCWANIDPTYLAHQSAQLAKSGPNY